MTLAKAMAVLAFATTSNAFWRMECRSKSGMARIDPLVNFGVPGEHVHAVHGGSGKSLNSTTVFILLHRKALPDAVDLMRYWSTCTNVIAGFSMTSDSADMTGSDCTSCSVKEDKSAYWHPALYFKAANGSLTAVNEDGGMLA